MAGEVGCASTAALLVVLLRVAPAEATARVRAAADLGPRYGLGGEPLGALFPTVAAAQAGGVLADRHAAVIRAAVDALPDQVQPVHDRAVEAALVAQAGTLDPGQLARVAARLVDTLDPEGTLTGDRDHQRRRSADLHANRDGSGELHAHLTPAALAVWQVLLDARATPAPGVDGASDLRTAGQRRHDALHDIAAHLIELRHRAPRRRP